MNNFRTIVQPVVLVILAILVLSGCSPTEIPQTGSNTQVVVVPTNPPAPTNTSSPEPSLTIAPTATTPPTETAIINTAAPTPTQGPLCVVQANTLNLRNGPGTPYRPPIRGLPAGTELVPMAFNPVGVGPQLADKGGWVQVTEGTQNEVGWVSAAASLLSCTVDLSTFPRVDVPPPPPPLAPRLADTSVDGGDQPVSWVWELDFNTTYLLRLRLFDSLSGETTDGQGIDRVTFIVNDPDGITVLERTERTAGFCIFGGGEPSCNPWVIEDYAYRWSEGGPPAKSGVYEILIRVVGNIPDEFGDPRLGSWNLRSIRIEFP
jgi:hypothetical protein